MEQALAGPLDETTASWLLGRGGGNPLWLRELVTGAVSTGALSLQTGLEK